MMLRNDFEPNSIFYDLLCTIVSNLLREKDLYKFFLFPKPYFFLLTYNCILCTFKNKKVVSTKFIIESITYRIIDKKNKITLTEFVLLNT